MTRRALAAPAMRIGPREFVWGERTYVMGVINVSPDSFSGDGLSSVDDAITLARRFIEEGADIIDVGGQSTRPGAVKTEAGFDEITAEEEIRRVVPVIERLRAELPDAAISIDTYKPEVARGALAAGAHLLNDIWGFHRDPSLARIAADAGVPAVVMHNQRAPVPMGRGPVPTGRGRGTHDVMRDVIAGLRESIRIADGGGLTASRLVVDPGFGFGWRPEQNLEMLRRLCELAELELPVLIGTSRKSTIATALGGASVADRAFGTAATVAIAIANGADIVRVHDVAAMKQVALVTDAIVRRREDA